MGMNRLTGHHAASGYTPSKEALEAYHRLIDGDGQVILGNHPIEDNLPGKPLTRGSYAAHTRGLNTANIGVAILAMRNGMWANPSGGSSPVRLVQVDAYCKLMAELAIDYSIVVDRRFCLTHAEVQPTLGVPQRNKWDFDYDPRYRTTLRDPLAIGDELRQEIRIKMRSLSGRLPVIPPVTATHPDFLPLRQGATGPHVRRLQDRLRIWMMGHVRKGWLVVDGAFGPRTRDAVIAFQKKNELLPDGVVGPLTWTAIFKDTSA